MFRTRSIFSLPDELLSEILARVGACSLDDLLNAGLSCKLFNEIAFDKYVLRQASIEKIPAMPWHKNYSFLEKCRDSGNPEALYKQGVVEFFSYSNLEAGVAYLDIAAKSGHLGASYILGVIFLCKDDGEESNQKGMQHLDEVYRAKRLSEESSWRELRIHNPGDRAVSMQAIGDLALSIANWRSCRIDHS
ncbi:hypothetical protein WN944_024730 [Citrus x changshan-huyou]|uniref:F-box domain-containing protein n=1 Tax=Citrus x changshan-huyou TaxID=2935761 RepID=A0AAP0LP77_9ROSI